MRTTTFRYRFACLLGVGLALGAAHQAHAQATGGPTSTPTPTTVPIDGGASLLLAGGVAYGLRKLRQRRQQ